MHPWCKPSHKQESIKYMLTPSIYLSSMYKLRRKISYLQADNWVQLSSKPCTDHSITCAAIAAGTPPNISDVTIVSAMGWVIGASIDPEGAASMDTGDTVGAINALFLSSAILWYFYTSYIQPYIVSKSTARHHRLGQKDNSPPWPYHPYPSIPHPIFYPALQTTQ